MIRFIELTQWSSIHYSEILYKKPVFINCDKILSLSPSEHWYVNTEEEMKLPIKDRLVESRTWVSCGVGEDSEGWYVLETPQQIQQKIGQEEEYYLLWKLSVTNSHDRRFQHV